ncbi:DUF2934 domain-containing protein [Pseudomonas mangiferae]|uniref:DUF2934 domain-containing protein n=1 Tax=Pseudomonas mangiferae TaxID=2593654 RepID=UPI0015B74B30|nr:DUF2934 domain-containing protein [Pseudomonas mangiferae]
MKANEQRIREFAYQIWESEGKPHGQDSRHWEMAVKLAEAEAAAGKAPKARRGKAAETGDSTAKAKAPRKTAASTSTGASTAKPEAGKSSVTDSTTRTAPATGKATKSAAGKPLQTVKPDTLPGQASAPASKPAAPKKAKASTTVKPAK